MSTKQPGISKLKSNNKLNLNFKEFKSTKNIIISKFNLDSRTVIKLNNGEELSIKFNELEVEKRLGRGEFGQVIKMTHKPSRISFAVKSLHESFIESSENKNSCLMDLEVSIRIGNSSPYLIQFFGALYTDSYIWILQEPMDTSLDKFYIKSMQLKIRLPDFFMSKVAFSMLKALQHMKRLKLIHRDVKPSNILLNLNGNIKLSDFGISGFTNSNSICNSFKGCQIYMAPEKVSITDQGYSIKSDIWSLAISLIEISNGVHPYIHINGPLNLSVQILDIESPRLDSNKFSVEFCSFVDQCLIKNVENRPGLDILLEHAFVDRNLLEKNSNYNLALTRLVIEELRQSEK